MRSRRELLTMLLAAGAALAIGRAARADDHPRRRRPRRIHRNRGVGASNPIGPPPVGAAGDPALQPQGPVPLSPQGPVPLNPQGAVPLNPQGAVPLSPQGAVPLNPQGPTPTAQGMGTSVTPIQ
ncbi:MAG: hypothetical protein KC466_08740 [Myxococcales bacterium]|nr:hypothetical protein [Myxococcales bacterium]